jgi:3-deoxy-D-arabino-heptulosonate 7-phosphate (DAHP) synthase class II
VTKACLRCHEEEARDFVTTAHWLWKGPATYTVNRQHQEIGKANITLNNF